MALAARDPRTRDRAGERPTASDDDVTVDLDVGGKRLGMTLPFTSGSPAERKRDPHAHP